MLKISPRVRPPLDGSFLPASLWTRAYRTIVAQDAAARPLTLALLRDDGSASIYHDRVLSADHPAAAHTYRHVERLLKFLLWQRGGCRVLIAGADELAPALARCYAAGGERAFDAAFMGGRVYRRPFSIEAARPDQIPAASATSAPVGRHLEGCRIGFDLGGTNRKVAALIDGRVVFTDETPWNPYFHHDPQYHLDGIQDSIARAAAHLPRVDAIGGSAAGIIVNNEVRVSSLFRGVRADDFETHVRPLFHLLRQRWDGVPFEVYNDGEVTALAGAMPLHEGAVLGISMGTSQAGGYVTLSGSLTPWLNELAFVPIDYRPDAPRDEWSGDAGCGVQYFSQQAVVRLARLVFDELPAETSAPERLAVLRAALRRGAERVRAIYETIGTWFGYAIAQYASFYDLRHVVVMGGVVADEAGPILTEAANAVLRVEFPALAETIRVHLPDASVRLHAQAIAAASLPSPLARHGNPPGRVNHLLSLS